MPGDPTDLMLPRRVCVAMEIQVREKCTGCVEGAGEVPSPAYVTWSVKADADMGELPPYGDYLVERNARLQWFNRWDVWEEENPMPPDSLPCIECDATTWLQKWVSVETLARILHDELLKIGGVQL